MTEWGAYSEREIYYPEDLEALVTYARLRGVHLIPELDAPAHAGSGWNWGPAKGHGELTLCFDAQPWTEICGQVRKPRL
jgi:hexosaminidase